MMTFLPFPSYQRSAQVLDNKRLGCQRMEGLILLRTNLGLSNGWKWHPCTRQWKGYESSLAEYLFEIISEWKKRGFRDSCEQKLLDIIGGYDNIKGATKPYWLGDEEFHSSHRAALLFKKYDYYKQFGWTEKAKMNYKWFI